MTTAEYLAEAVRLLTAVAAEDKANGYKFAHNDAFNWRPAQVYRFLRNIEVLRPTDKQP